MSGAAASVLSSSSSCGDTAPVAPRPGKESKGQNEAQIRQVSHKLMAVLATVASRLLACADKICCLCVNTVFFIIFSM